VASWKPREHDHLIEPFLAGLPGDQSERGEVVGAREDAASAARESRRTLIAVLVVAVLLVARVVVLVGD
jgi:hypothetical protein